MKSADLDMRKLRYFVHRGEQIGLLQTNGTADVNVVSKKYRVVPVAT